MQLASLRLSNYTKDASWCSPTPFDPLFFDWYDYFLDLGMEDKPLSPRWFVQGMALIAIVGFTIPMIAGVAGYLKQELSQPSRNEKQG